jgi:hypothetical protein
MSNYIPGDPQVNGPYDFSVPGHSSAGTAHATRTVYGGNYIFIRVGGQKLMVTPKELQALLDQGQDVEVRTPGT